ncbi:MAG: hypothetical protein N4A35_08620 [Flavobacteriales bacterium]|nr:hypothetical protein [Flavobacteriales bacterium]
MDISTKDMLFAMQQHNLVYNYNFLYYSNKDSNDIVGYNHPDGWLYQDKGANAEIGFDEGTGSCLIQKSSDDTMMTFKQVISEFPRWEAKLLGQKVSTCFVVQNPSSATVDFELTFYISDGCSTSTKTIVLKSGEQKKIALEINIDQEAKKLEIHLECSTPKAIIYVNRVYANIGEVALENLPCIVNGIIGERKQYVATNNAPAEELSLCNGVLELTDKYTRLRSVINNRFGINDETKNPYLINMGGYFSRAWDNGSGIDPDAADRTSPEKGVIKGDNVSTLEKDIFLKHHHGLNFSFDKPIPTGKEGTATVVNTATKSTTEDESEGKETRPINIAELYTIKWA